MQETLFDLRLSKAQAARDCDGSRGVAGVVLADEGDSEGITVVERKGGALGVALDVGEAEIGSIGVAKGEECARFV